MKMIVRHLNCLLSPHSFHRYLPLSKRLPSLIAFLACLTWVQAQTSPTIVSTVPANLATGVSPTAPIVFTFSTAMNTTLTYAIFFDVSAPLNPLMTVNAWSADGKTLTCTPTPPLPSPNKMIAWDMNGFDTSFNLLEGNTSGFFTTGSGGASGTGSGTNKITTFSVGKVWYYDQTSSLAPFLDPDVSYSFYASTVLASNRTATSISLTTPPSVVKNLNPNPISPEIFYTSDFSTNLAPFDAQYPSGNYLFNVQATGSNQQVTVNLPASLTQPPAPHVSNFTAAQSVDPKQSFTLSWDAFTGGTAADYIGVQLGTNFMTANPGEPGALTGTATSVLIPANTLPPSRFLDSCYLSFYRYVSISNNTYTTMAYRATSTRFFLTTTAGSASSPLVLTNASRGTGGGFSFEITSTWPNNNVAAQYPGPHFWANG